MNAPEGIRNNNPYNLTYVPSISWQGQTGHDGRFCIFDTTVNGLRAGVIDTCNHVLKGGAAANLESLIGDPVHGQAPANENDTVAYVKFMASHMGIGPTDTVDIRSAAVMASYSRGITIQEQGGDWAVTISDEEIDQAVAEAFQHVYGATS